MSAQPHDALAEQQQQLQNTCMPAITIRDIPPDTRNELAARAAASGRSLQHYLRAELIRLAERPDNVAIVSRAHERLRQSSEGLTGAQILELHDADRASRE
jgi:plasmid stability protein